MLLMIDNYDSFTYNLVQYIGSINPDLQVYRNNKLTIKDIEKLQEEVAKKLGYKLVDHKLELYGSKIKK